MNKVFEDKFSEIQTDMIKICLEYANYSADIIYIYASYEENIISCDYFYKINETLAERHKLNKIDSKKYDTSIQRQKACMKILNEDMKKLISACQEYKRDMPTEIKLIYDVKNNNVNANYEYDIRYSNSSNKTADTMAEEWFNQIRNN